MKQTFTFLMLCVGVLSAVEPPPKLAEQLLSNDSEIRLKAVEVFNQMPSEAKYKMVPDFMVALSSEEPAVRTRATKILNILGVRPPTPMPDAKETLVQERQAREASHPPSDDRQKALQELRQNKPDGFESMRQSLEEERQAAGFADPRELKGQTGTVAAAYPLIEALKEGDVTMRIRAARRLGELRPAPMEAIPLLTDLLKDKDKELRVAAAGALGGFGPDAREAIPALMKALADPDDGVRQIVSDALKQIQIGY